MNFKLKMNSFLQKGLIVFLYMMVTTFMYAQSNPIPINGTIDKRLVKFATYELFYEQISQSDLIPGAARVNNNNILKVRHQHVYMEGNKIYLDGNAVFATPLDSLPFLNNVELEPNGQIGLPAVEYYFDNNNNLYTESELWLSVNNTNNTVAENGCINFVYNEVTNSGGSCVSATLTEPQISIINAACQEMASIICCDDSSPVTIEIFPVIAPVSGNQGVAAFATPLYQGNDSNAGGNCNNITNNPVLSGLLGEEQPTVANVTINLCLDWYTGTDPNGIGNSQADLYTVVLHELIHAIGIGSRITEDGSPLGGNYSPWDLFLEVEDNDGNTHPLLQQIPSTNPLCCYSYEPLNTLNGQMFSWPEDVIEAGQNGLISIDGVDVGICNGSPSNFLNFLSHLSEDCSTATTNCIGSDYILYWELCTGETNRVVDEDELLLLEILGYGNCPNSGAESCYTSLNDDGTYTVTEGENIEIPISDLLINDVIATSYSNSDLSLVTSCGDASGVNVSNSGTTLSIDGLTPGSYTFCYQIETCAGFCDVAEVTIFVRPESLVNGCEPEDCNLVCFGDFEDFVPNVIAPVDIQEGVPSIIEQHPGVNEYIFDVGTQNTPDIVEFNGNNFIRINNRFFESFYFPLETPVSDGCEMYISFQVDCAATANIFSTSLWLYGSNEAICPQPTFPINHNLVEQMCDSSNPFYQLGELNAINCEAGGGNGQPDFDQSGEFLWTNNTGGDINYITLFGSGDHRSVLLDNIVVTSSCDTQLELTDITPPENTFACSGETVTLDYEICLTGDGGATDVTLNPSFDNAPLGWGNVVSPSFPLTVTDLAVGECATIQMTVELSEDVFPGQSIPIDMNISNYDFCNQQGDQISSVITITNELPSASFNFLLDCMSNSSTVSFIAFEPSTSGTTFVWDFGDGNTSTSPTPTHSYAQNGNYTVSLTVQNECGIATSSQIINVDCEITELDCPCPGGGIVLVDDNITQYTISGLVANGTFTQNVLSGGCIALDGTLTIDQDYLFNSVQIILSPGAAIIVPSGFTLSFDSSILTGCTELWEGITVQDGGTVRLINSFIQDAVYGLHLLEGSAFSSNKTTYDSNYIGIFADGGGNFFNNISMVGPFINNTFDCNNGLLPYSGNTEALIVEDCTFAGIRAQNVSLQISAGFQGAGSNYFRNIYNGIRALEASVYVTGGVFENILFDSSIDNMETGHGIFMMQSVLASIDNHFNNMEYAIRGNQSALREANDEISNIRIGVEMSNSPNQYISTFQTKFTNYTDQGMAIFSSPNTTINYAENIVSNTVFTQLQAGFPEALIISNSGTPSEIYPLTDIRDNVMTLAEGQGGISLSNVQDASIYQNAITFLDDPNNTGAWSRGLRLANAPNCILELNSVTAPNLSSSGFEVQNSSGSQFCCNSADGTRTGIQFSGLGCDDTALGVSGLSNNNSGLTLDNAIIGGQEHMGNCWNNSSANYQGDPTFVDASLFQVDANDGTPNCLILPPANLPQWFQNEAGQTPFCDDGGICVSGERPSDPKTIGEAEIIAAQQDFDGEYHTTANWIMGMHLLQKLNTFPTEMLNRNQDVDDFYTDYNDSPMAAYINMRQSIKALFELDASTTSTLTGLRDDIEAHQANINMIDQQMIQTTDPTALANLYQQREQYRLALSSDFSMYQNTLSDIETARAIEASNLLTQNTSLVATHTAATNEKLMNKVVLKTILDPTHIHKTKIKNQVSNIAHQCVASGGLAVYTARGWYDYITPGNQNDWRAYDDCYTNQERNLKMNHDLETNALTGKIDVYPNPNTGQFTIQLPALEEEATIVVSTLLGKTVHQEIVPKATAQLQIDLTHVKGVFFVTVTNASGFRATQKIIVQ